MLFWLADLGRIVAVIVISLCLCHRFQRKVLHQLITDDQVSKSTYILWCSVNSVESAYLVLKVSRPFCYSTRQEFDNYIINLLIFPLVFWGYIVVEYRLWLDLFLFQTTNRIVIMHIYCLSRVNFTKDECLFGAIGHFRMWANVKSYGMFHMYWSN